MSVDMPMVQTTPPARGAGPHAHARGGAAGDDEAAFTSLLSGEDGARKPDGKEEAEPKAAAQGAAKWHAREHAHWHVFDAMKRNAGPDAAGPGAAGPGCGEEADAAAEADPEEAVAVIAPVAMPVAAPADPGGKAAADGGSAGRVAVPDARALPETPKEPKEPKERRAEPSAGLTRMPARNDIHAGSGRAQLEADGRPQPQDGPALQPVEPEAAAPEAARDRGARIADLPAREAAGGPGAAKVTVLSAQVAPAPAGAPGLSPTSAGFVRSLAGPEGLTRYAGEPAFQTGGQPAARPVTTLRIQLQPVDLGTVTAKLSGDSEKLSIEVQVDNHEARHRLQSDGEAIVKALRAMGFDIDRITVQQVPQASATPGGGSGRENAFAAPDRHGSEGQGQSGKQEAGRGYEGGRKQDGNGERGEARGGGVYI